MHLVVVLFPVGDPDKHQENYSLDSASFTPFVDRAVFVCSADHAAIEADCLNEPIVLPWVSYNSAARWPLTSTV